MIYYLTFGISILCMTIYSRLRDRVAIIGNFFLCIGVLSITILNGVRDYSIGTDIGVYGNTFYNIAINSSKLVNYFENLNAVGGTEPGYAVLNYVISRISDSPHLFYFFVGLIINVNILYAILNIGDKINVAIAWGTFLFLYYPTTLNLLRQSISVSMVLLGISMVYKKNSILKSAIPFICACLFHNSTVIALIIYILGVTIVYIDNKKVTYSAIGGGILFSIILPHIVFLLNEHGIFDSKYEQYLSWQGATSIIGSLLIRVPILIGVILIFVLNKKTDKSDIYIYILMIMEILLLPLQNMSVTIGRLMLYFGISRIVGYPLVLSKFKENKYIYFLLVVLYMIYIVVVFYYQIVISHNNEVYPFIIGSDI